MASPNTKDLQHPAGLRDFKYNEARVPTEFKGVLRTSDKEIYVRDATTGAIRSTMKRPRGKAAVRAAKRARRG